MMRTGALATASDIMWQVTEYRIYELQQRLLMRTLVLVYRLSEITILVQTYIASRTFLMESTT